ncbi:MAG: twin-arginine translocase subunit TatC [Solirubrobacterales bacterium]|nr:twin-arginine translocase subunit TatC [Solirubrobacterales bacterium]
MRIRPIGHDDRLSVVDHLDELRGRLIASVAVLIVVFGVCWWQNHRLLGLLDSALPKNVNSLITSTTKTAHAESQSFAQLGVAASRLSAGLKASHGVSDQAVSAAAQLSQAASRASRELPRIAGSERNKPLTIGVGETFTATLTVAGYFALLITLPFLLYQAYAFILPGLHRNERRVALPVMIGAPVLFVMGVVVAYLEVLPPAVHFLQGYNSNQFNVLVQAGTYYKFEVVLMAAIGLAFQTPLVLLGLQRLGIVSSSSLTGNWRYAVLVIVVIVGALPGVDPVSMLAETLPLVFLYLVSIILLKVVERYDRRREALASGVGGGGLDAT